MPSAKMYSKETIRCTTRSFKDVINEIKRCRMKQLKIFLKGHKNLVHYFFYFRNIPNDNSINPKSNDYRISEKNA